MGSKGQNSTLSEHYHVAYQNKGNHRCNSIVANSLHTDLPTRPPDPGDGINRSKVNFFRTGRQQSKTLSRGLTIDRNSVFECHLSQVWRQIAIENPVFNNFGSMFLDSFGVCDCRLPGLVMSHIKLKGITNAARW